MSTPTPNLLELARRISELQDQVASTKVPQLAYSSIEDGAITEYNHLDEPVAQYGQQFDGAHIAMPFTGPDPLEPTPATVTAAPGALVIAWDGEWVDDGIVPTDFSRVEVHVCDTETDPADTAVTLYATIETPRGGEVTITLLPGVERWVRLVARSIPGKAGPPSVAVAGTPGAIISSEVLDDINADLGAIDTLLGSWTAPDSVSINGGMIYADSILSDSIGANQILALHILAGEITAGKLAAGAVIAGTIAANAVTSSTIATGAITTDKLDANAINGIVITGSTLRTGSSGARMVLRPGDSSIGFGDGVLEIFSGNSSESFPAEIYTIADGAGATDNISLYIQAPGKTGYGSRPFIQMFAKDADNSSDVVVFAEIAEVRGSASGRLESGPSGGPYSQVRVDATGWISFFSGATLVGTISATEANFANDIQLEGNSMPRGWTGSVEATTNSGTVSTSSGSPTSVLSVNLPLEANRRYIAHVAMHGTSTVAADRIYFILRVDGVNQIFQLCTVDTANQPSPVSFSYSWSNVTAGTKTVEVMAYRQAGTGNCIMLGAAGAKATITVEDIGGA